MNEQLLDELLPQGHHDMLNAYHEYMAQASDIRNQITESDMKTLHLPLKKEWYEMIESGIKTEEYREIKPYWVKRLCPCTHVCSNGHWSEAYYRCVMNCKALHSHMNHYHLEKRIGTLTRVKFSYGYTKRTMTFEIKDISIGTGKPEWGAPNEDVFIIKLGERIE